MTLRAFDRRTAGVTDQRTHGQHIAGASVDDDLSGDANALGFAGHMRTGDDAKRSVLVD